ncbi:MAG: hypothetical protein NC123_19510 [Butyrivibrio sp.]|nr:hypothetical protein [Butyrivibrio sp.]
MKSKNTMHVPDGIYEALGLILPFSKSEGTPEYEKGGSVTEFIGNQRISTLKRESRYRIYYPKLQEINLLTLNYPSIPQDADLKADYVKKVIRKSILKNLASLSPEKKANEKCGEYVKDIFSLYDGYIHAEYQHYCHENVEQSTPFKILQAANLIHISFHLKGGASAYADPFSSKKKAGYYYLTSNPSQLVHIINLPDLLVDILLIQAVHHIQANIKLAAVQDIFEKYIQIYSEQADRLQEDSETNALVTSLSTQTLLPYDCLFHNYNRRDKDLFYVGLSDRLSEKLTALFCDVLEICQDIQYENKHRNEMARTIATAYITKKNIPQKTLEAMEHTLFKNYFKYVEFDEEVDLDAVKTLEKEFKIINEAYFSGKAFFDVKLRFRKLGKHKASGLYYPTIHTLCVDLRSPSSFIHEYFHMLDDQMGDLSLGRAFQDIVGEYKKAFLKELEHLETGIQAQLKGSSKYNLSYFFRRAEIFARCGEIYFVRVPKVESSLIKPDLKYAYPASEQLDELIKNYYEDLLDVRLKQSGFAEAV